MHSTVRISSFWWTFAGHCRLIFYSIFTSKVSFKRSLFYLNIDVVHRPTVKKANLPLNPTSNKHLPIWIARGRSSEQESACFQARILPVISKTKVLVWLEKRSSCHGNRELSILLYTLVLTSVWLKSSTDLENFFFSQNCVLCRYGTGCGFPIRNLEGQKNARWKYRNLPLPSIHWHAHSPPITHFLLPGSIGLSSPEFLVFISGFFCFLST